MRRDGLAFPYMATKDTQHGVSETGMELRDYFAAKAMQGLISGDRFDAFTSADLAKESYTIADAMLTEREKINHIPFGD